MKLLCECETLASLIHIWDAFSWTQRIFKSGGHLELQSRHRTPLTWYKILGYKAPFKVQVHRDRKGANPTINLNPNIQVSYFSHCISNMLRPIIYYFRQNNIKKYLQNTKKIKNYLKIEIQTDFMTNLDIWHSLQYTQMHITYGVDRLVQLYGTSVGL